MFINATAAIDNTEEIQMQIAETIVRGCASAAARNLDASYGV